MTDYTGSTTASTTKHNHNWTRVEPEMTCSTKIEHRCSCGQHKSYDTKTGILTRTLYRNDGSVATAYLLEVS
jgi:hypothetical protein